MNVLVVDDTKNIRTLLTKCLEMEGHSVKAASDGKTALEMMEQKRFDLIFLDIKMPLFSGTEVLKSMREMGIDTPVIIITAYGTVKNAVDCTQLGAVAYLQKPFTAGKIRNIMAEMTDAGGQKLPDIVASAEKALAERAFSQAENILKSKLSQFSLEPQIYLLLSKACEKQGKTREAQKYRRMAAALR